ncbi:DNA (cytosine-5)-methyltransferase 1-like [Cydia strobilella]|uniref:DNA (cytosine-5)-methyltransferase 1-like n=1 Tax=Cydia strobilella TaxID=1100964 RepID=UPI003004FA2B
MPSKSNIIQKNHDNGGSPKSTKNIKTTPNKAKLRSSNGKQLSITSMLAVKRGRSPSEDAKLTSKKLKTNLDESLDDAEENDVVCAADIKDVTTDAIKDEDIGLDDENMGKTNGEETNNLTSSDDKIDINITPKNNSDAQESLTNGKNGVIKADSDENHNYDEKTAEQDEKNSLQSNEKSSLPEPDMERCNTCGQFINNSDIIYFQGHPQDAVEEFIALTNEKLVLAAGDEGDIMERPQTNITGFSIFDREGHLVPIDGGLVESDLRIYMSGYLKSICSESPEIDEESVPVKDVGPIIEWFIHGFDGGSRNCITLSTEFGEYNLMNPSPEYTSLMNNLYEKIWISKVVVEYLEEFHYLQPNYEDLLEVIREAIIPELGDKQMTEEMLHKHAQFVCDQVVSLEADEDEAPLITLPCMRELIKLMGIKFGKRKIRAKIDYKKIDKKAWTKATTTPLVRKTFESFFTDQLDKTNHELVLRRKRCGVCEACQLPDCGECNACRAMAKFGGQGRSKQACVRRRCPNMAVQQADDSDNEEDEPDRLDDRVEDVVPVKLTGSGTRKIKWIGKAVKADATKVYYDKVEIDGSELCNGDYVMVETAQAKIPALVARVVYMWMEISNPKSGYFHAEVFIRATDTVLGEVGDPREVFLGDRCCHGAPLSSILRKANVEKREIPNDWFGLGGKEVQDEGFEDDGKTYFYKKCYERFTARFEDLPADPPCPNALREHRFCPSCERKTKRDGKNIPKLFDKLAVKSEFVKESNRSEWSYVSWLDHIYKKGSGVFLKPDTFKLKTKELNPDRAKLEKVDESIYTEYYRKSDNNLRGSNIDTGEPFCVGHIAAVVARGDQRLVAPQDILLKVRLLLRPENVLPEARHSDLNLVYWTDDIREVPFSAVAGPCQLIYEENIPGNHQEWLSKDPNRFYFRQAYDKASGKFSEVPEHAANIGRAERKDKGKGKGKGKGKAEAAAAAEAETRPLRTLDVFAGCGGLSAGLHAAGIASCRWAVEHVEAAAHAYALNNPGCSVFREDCNALLAAALAGATHSAAALRLPAVGEVELMCGGPPCQGFSGMNRFNSREYSNFKNSLVATYLSFCDYYRPKYFILENVRNFVAFKKGMVLKLTLRTLLDMGYQCTFGVLQAGNYGVPQTRRRLIIMAAAPGFKLPLYPEPTHVFSRRACSLTINIDGKRFVSNIQWEDSAPRRTCTIRDAMSDLPDISNGASKIEIEYGSMPVSHFQRMIRSKDENAKLRDHICKNMAPLIVARISRIPTTPGSDWRDLPNISVTLSDGTKCKVLQYRHIDKSSRNGERRGVCACAGGGACDPADRQENTLIPWCLPHTANRHNNWAGLYGRVCWDGYFSTTVTDPEPMGKQGRVLHPQQPRVVSVRECARSQGFPDTYLLAGSVLDKHRQVGNAVPPPLGEALGREIKKAFQLSTTKA